LLKMTPSEFCTVLTAGMATVASNVLAIYVFTLRDYFPNIAGHLVSASIIAAPSALIMSKMLLPESGEPVTLGVAVAPVYEKEESLFVALINGANTGLKVAAGIAALLLAVLGLVALLDLVMTMLGGRVNLLCGLQIDWSLKGLLGYLFYPLMLVIGIPAADAGTIAGIVGERVVVTEITAYQDLAAAMANDVLVHKRSAVIATYALCGFAHVASVAIFVGGISALVPQRTADLARVGMRALVAATLACLLTACIAGTFFNQTSLLMN
ncbi:MAG: nucleoside transporter, partial [Deltaproteobacteria bacterium]|nr:nucleoside transporter [Deltaproteobacteria bacterium]